MSTKCLKDVSFKWNIAKAVFSTVNLACFPKSEIFTLLAPLPAAYSAYRSAEEIPSQTAPSSLWPKPSVGRSTAFLLVRHSKWSMKSSAIHIALFMIETRQHADMRQNSWLSGAAETIWDHMPLRAEKMRVEFRRRRCSFGSHLHRLFYSESCRWVRALPRLGDGRVAWADVVQSGWY